ncbi:hypothetical protein [Methyloceanibacter caenitepidi]|uniref:Uncharacterized protein n=1 Tax=Methyloceanibacter caenitepidi TaxID=1384459 RepID=A0A0A8K025_9HYPH|nr:hypothetical protein [Methyloceanibacter caenitepidi]BAQ16111.1 hypothetical protein GL4_0648 [Methyloceanibacter caenitepidi]
MMFGSWGGVLDLWHAVSAFVSAGFVGGLAAAVGFGAGAFYFSRNLIGFVAAAAIGVLIVGGVGWSSAMDLRAATKIAQLEAEKAAIQRDFDIAKLAAEAQEKIVAEQQEILIDNEAVFDRLNDAIAKHAGGNDECVIYPDELEAINEIR